MSKPLIVSAALLALTGCGVAEVGAGAAAEGASKAEELRQARQTEARVQGQVDAASREAAQQRETAESAAQ